MKKQIALLLCMAAMLSCGENKTVKTEPISIASQAKTDSTLDNDNTVLNGKSLNDIRFGDWEESDWLDNDYIRTLRNYIDDFNKGKVDEPGLEPYKNHTKGKFMIANVEPFIGGGLFFVFIFVDMPDRIFESWVYSSVDMKTEKVTSYEVRGISPVEEKADYTKEELLQIAKEHPEFVW